MAKKQKPGREDKKSKATTKKRKEQTEYQRTRDAEKFRTRRKHQR